MNGSCYLYMKHYKHLCFNVLLNNSMLVANNNAWLMMFCRVAVFGYVGHVAAALFDNIVASVSVHVTARHCCIVTQLS